MITNWIIIILISYFAATITGFAGFGGGLLLLPILTSQLGLKEAIPVLTIAQIFGNLSRMTFSFSEIKWRPALFFMIGSLPASYLASKLFVATNSDLIEKIIGFVILLIIAWRRIKKDNFHFNSRAMIGGGLLSGFLSGITGVGGPVAAIFFLNYGLIGAAYISSQATTAILTHLTKILVYSNGELLTKNGLVYGFVIGITMILGSWTGKKIIDRLPKELFIIIVEVILLLTAIWFILKE